MDKSGLLKVSIMTSDCQMPRNCNKIVVILRKGPIDRPLSVAKLDTPSQSNDNRCCLAIEQKSESN